MRFWIIVGVLFIGFFIGKNFYLKPKFVIGATPPNFEAKLQDGSYFELKQLKGKYVLLDFWASWCAPCRKESKNLVQLDNDFHDSNQFEIVSIGLESNKIAWSNAVKQDELNWKYHVLELDDLKSPIAQLYGVKEIPTTYLLNPDGKIIGVNMSYESLNILLERKLNH